MFRRQENTIEPDPTCPADMGKLGFFINNADQIRMIGAPEKPFEFAATNNERYNEVRDEAMHICVRKEVKKRLSKLGIDEYYLPGLTRTKPKGPHLPILAPPPNVLKYRKRVFVIVNDSSQDLGILSYNRLQRDLGINGGSLVGLVKEMVKRSRDVDSDDESTFAPELCPEGRGVCDDAIPCVVVMNTGQLLYSHKQNQAMTMKSWLALPRKSIVHDAIRIHEKENRVKGHRTPLKHVRTVFDEVICNPNCVAPDAEVYLIAIENGVDNVLDVLAGDFEKYGSRITAMAVIQSIVDGSQVKLPSLRALLHQRTRQWKYTDITANPVHCIELPDDYCSGALCPDDKSRRESQPPKVLKRVNWNERISQVVPVSNITKAIRRFALRIVHPKKDSFAPANTLAEPKADAYADWKGPSVLCPTFAGGNSAFGESVLTDPSVQSSILAFFGQVIMDPEQFYNTDFKTYTNAPQATPYSPLVLDIEATNSSSASASASVEMTTKQVELDIAREDLARMRTALEACPTNVAELDQGRNTLTEKIAKKESEIARLEEKALASGGLKAGEAQDKRENWKPQAEGPKVPFAGTMIDSELLKAAGLAETAEEEVSKLDEVDKLDEKEERVEEKGQKE